MAAPGPYDVTIDGGVEMRARDGVTLVADVYRPVGPGPFPVLVRRTPYGRRANDLAASWNEAHLFASYGYLVVVQDTRGRFASGGRFYPFIHEAEDGYDTVEWAAGLGGTTGDVGMFGQSYGAMCQYLTAPLRPPHLRTAVPVSSPLGFFDNFVYHKGAFNLAWILAYFVGMGRDALVAEGGNERRVSELDEYLVDPDVRFSPLRIEHYRHRPLGDWAQRLADLAPFLADHLQHATDGPYWWSFDVRRQLHNVDIPILHVGSWYDEFQSDTLDAYTGVRDRGLSATTRHGQALMMGPWAHIIPYTAPTSKGTGDIDFGPEAAIDLHQVELDWFARHLNGEDAPAQPPVRIFVMGADRWRDEHDWPLARTDFRKCYLRSGDVGGDSGDGGSGGDGGSLSWESPGDEAPDTYRFDPDDPVPTCGGHYIGMGSGVADQRPVEARPDVLAYTSGPFAGDLELTGPVRMSLFASSSATDTDFVVTLVDVRPDGYAQNLSEGIVRGRFRDSYTEPALLEPGRVYELTVAMAALSHVVKAGHRLRVDVTSSSFPRWDANPNTGEPFTTATTVVVADQTVYHDTGRPSHLVLPVVP